MSDQTAQYSGDTVEISALERLRRKSLFYRVTQRITLRMKLMIVFVALIAMTVSLTLGFNFQTMTESHQAMAEGRTEAVCRALGQASSDHVENGDLDELKRIAKSVLAHDSRFAFVGFYDRTGAPIELEFRCAASAMPSQAQFNDVGEYKWIAPRGTPDGGIRVMVSAVDNMHSRQRVGYVSIGLAQGAIDRQIEQQLRSGAAAGGAMLLLAIPIAWLFVRRIFSPIRKLVVTARRIVAGDLEEELEPLRADTVGELGRVFNDIIRMMRRMQDRVKQVQDQMEVQTAELEKRIEQRAGQVEVANQRLSAEIAEKEDFLRAISHDLNAPLRNISGMVTMLLMKKKDQFDEDTLHRLDRVKKNVEVQSDLIHELLELSRIKTRRLTMENIPLESMVWDLRGMFENDLRTRDIQLLVDSALPVVHCEKARIRQVFQNLIDNAIKYMGEGQRREIHIGCHIQLDETEFYVRDTGMGIDPEDVDKVFFVFRRGRSPAAQQIPGKGVGLSSVKSIIENYNGKIWVESQLGAGSTFRFTMNGKFVGPTAAAVVAKPVPLAA